MTTHPEIDELLRRLEGRLPEWAKVYPASQFLSMLAQSLEYIAYSADPDAREHCLSRTGCLYRDSGERARAGRYGH